MKIFVAGATGVLGRRAVAQLVQAGHDVTGVARTEEKAELVRSLGATPVTVDLFDAAAVKGAVDGHEVVMNLATHIPPMSKAALPGVWSENDRIRSEASQHLADAALATGASRYVQESIAFMYPDSADRWIDEEVAPEPPGLGDSTLRAEAQAQRVTDAGSVGVVLRFGQFYAPDAGHTIAMVKATKKHIAPVLGAKDAYVSMIDADDAASAVVAALVAPPGIYNVTDDDPVTREEFAAIAADAAGVKRARQVPAILGKVSGQNARFMTRSQRVSNKRFKEATGWAPSHRSLREGWPAVVRQTLKET